MPSPAIILIRPQMPENIGAAARAMANFELGELRLVAPREPFPSKDAYRLASGADHIIDNTKIFETPQEAVADMHVLFASTARPRDMVKRVVTPAEMAREVAGHEAEGLRCGILFGPERTGLENPEITLCDAIVTIPTSPDFFSLNLAQAVLLMGYECLQAEKGAVIERVGQLQTALTPKISPPATKEQVDGLFHHLETELAASNFFKTDEKRPGMMQNIRNMLLRVNFTDQDVRTFRGMIKALAHKY